MRGTLEALGVPTRRRILEVLAATDLAAGELAALFEISRPAVSRHLRVLREARLVTSTPSAQRRVYALAIEPLDDVGAWVAQLRSFWSQRLDALALEVGPHAEPEGGRDDD